MSTARYGDGAVYGEAGLTYGEASVDRKLTWGFEIDWDGDGIFNGENEGKYLYSLETENGRMFYLQGNGEGFEPTAVGKMTANMRNESRRFDPYYEEGPLYGMILPGRKFRLRVRREADGVVDDVMTGSIDDIRPSYGTTKQVKITGSNGIKKLNKKVSTPVQTNIRFDEAIALCLEEINWGDGSNIDTTVSEQMNYWWGSGNSAFSELTSIADSALGLFFVREDGAAVYKSRVSGDVSLVTVENADILESYGIRVPTPWDVVKNNIRVYSRTRKQQSDVELWRLSDITMIPAGETRTIWASFSQNDVSTPALSVTTPVPTTDYTANAQADGLGTDLTGNIVITMTPFSKSAKLVVTNTGGTDAYMTLTKLRGVAIVADEYTFVERTDEDSITAFEEREFVVKSDWLQDVNTASDQADILKARLATPRKFPRVMIKDKPDKQFGQRLFELSTLLFTNPTITGDFRVGYVKHTTTDASCETVESEFYYEPNLFGNISGTWVFPAVFGLSTVF